MCLYMGYLGADVVDILEMIGAKRVVPANSDVANYQLCPVGCATAIVLEIVKHLIRGKYG